MGFAPVAPPFWRGRAKLKEKIKRAWPWYLLAVALVVADQLVKLWVRSAMALGEARPFIPHFIELYHLQNTGGAFSLLAGQTWILTVLSAVATVALIVCLWGDYVSTNVFSRLCVTCVLAGAAGNLIDRVVFGAVTDMFNFTFIRFGVFNVADMWVVGGVIGYCGYLLWEQFKAPKPEDKTHEADH